MRLISAGGSIPPELVGGTVVDPFASAPLSAAQRDLINDHIHHSHAERMVAELVAAPSDRVASQVRLNEVLAADRIAAAAAAGRAAVQVTQPVLTK